EKSIDICSTKSIRAAITCIYIQECPKFISASDELKNVRVFDGYLAEIGENLWDEQTLLDYDYEFLHIHYNKNPNLSFNNMKLFFAK
ncbi:MAG TPA: hypothetical protein PK987_08290, partial [Ferruginibacter sp.]|nr:hypothetical protein [Ferruginibacter sp.]